MFYIGTSYLMNVHFGSKDFHLSCFGVSLRKKPNIRSTLLHLQRFPPPKKTRKHFSTGAFLMSFCFAFQHSLLGASWGMIGIDPNSSEPQKFVLGIPAVRYCIEILASLQTAFCGIFGGLHCDFDG